MMTYITDLKGLGQVRRNPEYSDKEVRLLEIITDHCQYCLNTGVECELSYSTIRKWTGWNRNYISKTIKSLVSRGDITADSEHIKGNMKSTTKFTSMYVIEGGGTKVVPGSTKVVPGGSTKVVPGGGTKVVLNNNNNNINNIMEEVGNSDYLNGLL